MMRGRFTQTVTLYHESEGEHWSRIVLRGVYFAVRSGKRFRRTGATPDDGGTMLIPCEGFEGLYSPPGEWSGEGWTIDSGDRLLEGAHDYEIVRSPSELRRLGEVHTVTSIRRLPFGRLAHWKVWCDGSQD